MAIPLLPLAAALAAPPPPPAWAPPQQCFTAAGAADRPPAECRPGVEQCQRQPWGADTPQYHLRDRTCSVGDPNEPVYDPQHRLYHLFYRECSSNNVAPAVDVSPRGRLTPTVAATEVGDGNFPGSPASGLWWPRGSLVQGPLQGHAVSRDLVHWSHLPVALWNDQPFDSVAVYTGSATVVNGSVAIIYPGVCDGARAGTNPGPVVWPTCSADGAHHYNLVLARPGDPNDPFLTNWTKRLIFNNTQRVSPTNGCPSHDHHAVV